MNIFIALFFFLLYTVFILYYGKYGFSQSNQLRSFYVADHGLGLWASVSTFCATWISITSLLAISGSFYVQGIIPLFSVVLGWIIGAFFLLIIAKKLRKYSLKTVPEFFLIRYQSSFMQLLAGITVAFTHLCYIIIQIYGFGIVLSYLLEIPYLLSIFMVYLFLIYTTFGGLKSIAKTDSINFIWIFLSISILGVIVAQKLTEKQLWEHYLNGIFETRHFISALDTPESNVTTIFFSTLLMSIVWILGKASHPQYLVRIISAKDDVTAIRMIWISIVIFLFIYLAIALIGTGSKMFAPSLISDNSDEFIILLIKNVATLPIASFLLMGILASAISTANSQLLILSSSIANDMINSLKKKKLSERKLANINRIVILSGSTLALLLTLNPPFTLITLGSYLWGVLAFSLFWPLYGGLLWKKATRQGAYASMIGGIGIGGVLIWYHLFVSSIGIIHPAVYAVMGSGILFFCISLYTFKDKGKFYD